MFESLWTNIEIWWKEKYAEQSGDWSSHRGRIRARDVEHEHTASLVLGWSKWRETTDISVARWNTIDSADNTLDGNENSNWERRTSCLLLQIDSSALAFQVMNNCLNLLCERLQIPNGLEYDEYSIFIISKSGQN